MGVCLKVLNGDRPERPAAELCGGETLPDNLWKLIQQCWAQEPSDRLSIHDVVIFFRSMSPPILGMHITRREAVKYQRHPPVLSPSVASPGGELNETNVMAESKSGSTLVR
jgi:hypothetical protein